MGNTGYRNLHIGSAHADTDSALRYLRGKDLRLIREDDPGFFPFPADSTDNVSPLSSSRRILRKPGKEAGRW